MIKFNREKTDAYFIRRSGFVNAFRHGAQVGLEAAGRKRVDSSSVRENGRLAGGLADYECGKTEEGSGKKGGEFFKETSRKMAGTSRAK
ncbi:MAG: hypothetical protein WBQ72_13610 [Terriglobales bacterium]|jgi:hypothetical protein